MFVAWQSKHIRRVLKSTLVAEILAIADMSEACLYYRKLLLEVQQLKNKTGNIKIIYKTNNSCLYDSAHLSIQILDTLRCSFWEKGLTKEIVKIPWIPTDAQIAGS